MQSQEKSRVAGLTAEEWAWVGALVAAGVGIGWVLRPRVASAATQPEGSNMPGPSEALKAQYEQRYRDLVVNPDRVAQVDGYADAVVANRARYEAVAGSIGVPWYVVGAIHLLESSLRFNGHLHNGDPLTARTTHVPRGKPASGEPPFTWEESAVDALARFRGRTEWSLAVTLWLLEKYNGWGYQNRNTPSPYLYSFSNQYRAGKFGSDGNYNPTLVSRQCGAATLLHRMEERGIISIPV